MLPAQMVLCREALVVSIPVIIKAQQPAVSFNGICIYEVNIHGRIRLVNMNIGIVIFYRYITVNSCQSAAIFKPCIFFNHDVIKVHLVINSCNISFYCPQFRKYGFIVSINLINYQRFNRSAAAIGIGVDN